MKLSLIGPLASRRRVLGCGFPAAAACTARRQTRGVFAFKHFLSWLQLFPAQPWPHMQRAARASPGQEPRHVSGFSAGEGQPQSAADRQGDTIGSRPARRHHTWRMCPAWRRSRLIFEDSVDVSSAQAVDLSRRSTTQVQAGRARLFLCFGTAISSSLVGIMASARGRLALLSRACLR